MNILCGVNTNKIPALISQMTSCIILNIIIVQVEYEATFLTRPSALLLLVCQQACSANLVVIETVL